MKSTVGIVMLAALAAAAPIGAQWLNYRSPDVPRTADGKADLSAPAPKAADGKPDLSGVWRPPADPLGKPENVENQIFPRYFANIAKDLKPDEIVLRPSADALFKERLRNHGVDSPEAHCAPVGVPGIITFPSPFKIVQLPRLLILLYEEDTTFRQIFTDGRRLPQDPNPSFMGYSAGRWEADTLVVESVGFRDGGWLDRMGHPHSDQLHLTERYRRRDVGHLSIEMTIDDPGTYVKPFTYTQPAVLLPDTDLLEYFCAENEKDVRHYK
jgi:hypothetical protein